MEDKNIIKNQEVLTRVSLVIDGMKLSTESCFADEDLLELTFNCIRAGVSYLGIDEKTFVHTLNNIVSGKSSGYEMPFNLSHTIKITMEQWSSRETVEIESKSNVIFDLLRCMKTCAIQATYLPSTVDNFLQETAEELQYFLEDENTEIEEENKD